MERYRARMLTKKAGKHSTSKHLTKKGGQNSASVPRDNRDTSSLRRRLAAMTSRVVESHGNSLLDLATDHITRRVSPAAANTLSSAMRPHMLSLASAARTALRQHAENAVNATSMEDFANRTVNTLADHANAVTSRAVEHVSTNISPEMGASLNEEMNRHVGSLISSTRRSLNLPEAQPAAVEIPALPDTPVPASGPVTAPARVPPTDAERVAAANEVINIVNTTQLPDPTIVNPNSKFVIVTYWWGRGNTNNNVKHPCAAYEKEDRDEIINELRAEIAGYDYIRDIGDATEKEAAIARELESRPMQRAIDSAMERVRETKTRNVVADLGISADEARNRLYRETPALKFEAMIARFEDDCRRAGCNFLTQEYPFGRPLYQAAINGKPVFIKKALEACRGKGPNGSDLAVVYIDGDMRANVYPKIFDMDGLDFMARGWNIDPRANRKYLNGDVCFDPYTFETSGGIQYFANTPASLDLLETWTLSNVANPGKADDRVISLAFNIFKYQLPLAYIQLPIEYLWLTDNYLFQKPDNTRVEKSIIEHPECLTGEDVAAEQGAAADRSPSYYDSLVEPNCECIKDPECERVGRKIYEFVMFPSQDLVETMGPYLEYLSNVTNNDGEKLFDVIPFANKYGRRQNIADNNIAQAARETEMPTDFDIPKILSQLQKGNDVTIGTSPKLEQLKNEPLEFIATNLTGRVPGDEIYPDLKPKFDVTKPMFFSAKNPVLYHLLAMSENGNDFSTVFNESFIFLERIRCYWL
jgi:hypothetical protein